MVHLIPYYGVGGVERAAASMHNLSCEHINFRVETIFPARIKSKLLCIWNPWFFIKAVIHVWQIQPDILIVSLWRACVVGVATKLLMPKMRLVLFIHFPNNVHCLDHFFTRFAEVLSCRVWADSSETLALRLPYIPKSKGQVISFVTDHFVSMPSQPVRAQFIFWGRIHPQKGLTRAIKIFAEILNIHSEARFLIIGPDCGDLSNLRNLVNSLGLGKSIQFLDAMSFSEIQIMANQASFYLQISELEGMAMSVVEAMQLGLVPVVTPVGEIARYARHQVNAVVVNNQSLAVNDVLALLQDDAKYQSIRNAAINTWKKKSLYKDSVLTCCREILELAE